MLNMYLHEFSFENLKFTLNMVISAIIAIAK